MAVRLGVLFVRCSRTVSPGCENESSSQGRERSASSATNCSKLSV